MANYKGETLVCNDAKGVGCPLQLGVSYRVTSVTPLELLLLEMLDGTIIPGAWHPDRLASRTPCADPGEWVTCIKFDPAGPEGKHLRYGARYKVLEFFPGDQIVKPSYKVGCGDVFPVWGHWAADRFCLCSEPEWPNEVKDEAATGQVCVPDHDFEKGDMVRALKNVVSTGCTSSRSTPISSRVESGVHYKIKEISDDFTECRVSLPGEKERPKKGWFKLRHFEICHKREILAALNGDRLKDEPVDLSEIEPMQIKGDRREFRRCHPMTREQAEEIEKAVRATQADAKSNDDMIDADGKEKEEHPFLRRKKADSEKADRKRQLDQFKEERETGQTLSNAINKSANPLGITGNVGVFDDYRR